MKQVRDTLLAAGLALAMMSPALLAAEEEPPVVPEQQATEFMEAILGEGWKDAPGRLLKGSNIEAENPQAASKIVALLEAQRAKFGEPLGYELARKEEIGTSVIYLYFILKFEAKPVVWEFFYYRPAEQWTLINLNIPQDFRGVRAPSR